MARECVGCRGELGRRAWQARLCWPCQGAHNYDPVKLAAHTAVARARRQGLLADPCSLKCADCGGPAIEYDHREYAKPLQVEPVCRRCNLLRGPAIDSAARHTSLMRPEHRKSA